MRRKSVVSGLVLGLGCFGFASPAGAVTLFDLSGRVALTDGVAPGGVKAKLQVDLDRNGKLESFETLSAKVASDGSYTLKYELDPKDVDLKFLSFASKVVADYEARGFESLLDDGPLPLILSFEREGYGTVVRRLNTLFESPRLDVELVPLADVQCASATCLSADGGVRLSDFPGGTKIARAYADAYDPSQETARFPGLWSDRDNNLLVSSGFAEINLYQADGSAVHQLSAPVKTRFEAKRASWSTLPDLDLNTGRIELPMYSFDPASAEWVAEANGELTFADGRAVPEDDLIAIRDGSYGERVFIDFETKHFSTFNCDAPISVRACVKGNIVAKGTGTALAGVSVSVSGVSYTGSAGTIITGLDGSFATDVRKSELGSEDLDGNGKRGEVLTARVIATGSGVFVADAFETPTTQGSVGQVARPGCKPSDCDCLDLGTIEVEFEEPRLCEITVESAFSGRDVVGGEGPVADGEPVVGAELRASLVGGVQLPAAGVKAACAGQDCGPVELDATGKVTFMVPVIGESPQIQLDASWSTELDGDLHYYSGSVVIAGCERGESVAPEAARLALDHSALKGLGDFIASLGDTIKTPSGDSGDPTKKDPFGTGGCGCRQAGGDGSRAPGLWALALLGTLGWRRRRG
jgi:MYXO-CTERM domain-containing protein